MKQKTDKKKKEGKQAMVTLLWIFGKYQHLVSKITIQSSLLSFAFYLFEKKTLALLATSDKKFDCLTVF